MYVLPRVHVKSATHRKDRFTAICLRRKRTEICVVDIPLQFPVLNEYRALKGEGNQQVVTLCMPQPPPAFAVDG